MPKYDLTGRAVDICQSILEEYHVFEWQQPLPPHLSNQVEGIDWLIEEMAYEWIVDNAGEVVRRRNQQAQQGEQQP